jgi:hypothetical protein
MFISYATNYFGKKFHITDYVFIFTEQFPSFRDYFMVSCFINDFAIAGQGKKGKKKKGKAIPVTGCEDP